MFSERQNGECFLIDNYRTISGLNRDHRPILAISLSLPKSHE